MVQVIPTDECAGKEQKRFMGVGTALIANTQAAKLMQPGKCALHDPAKKRPGG